MLVHLHHASCMAAEMPLAIELPVGDLSRFWPRLDVEMDQAEKKA